MYQLKADKNYPEYTGTCECHNVWLQFSTEEMLISFCIQRLKNETHNQFSPGPIPCCINIYELNILK